MYEPELRTQVSQGDIFADIPVSYVVYDAAGVHINTDLRRSAVMVLTRDCDYDKQDATYIIVAEIRPLMEIRAESQGHVRHRRVRHTFPLAATGTLAESYVDLRRMDRIAKPLFENASHSRIASLNDEARLALQFHIAMFFGYNPPPTTASQE